MASEYSTYRYFEQGLIAGFVLGVIIIAAGAGDFALRWAKFLFIVPGLLAGAGMAAHELAAKANTSSPIQALLATNFVWRTCATVLSASLSSGLFVLAKFIFR